MGIFFRFENWFGLVFGGFSVGWLVLVWAGVCFLGFFVLHRVWVFWCYPRKHICDFPVSFKNGEPEISLNICDGNLPSEFGLSEGVMSSVQLPCGSPDWG